MVPARKFSTTTSAPASRSSKTARSPSSFRLRETLSLPRLIDMK